MLRGVVPLLQDIALTKVAIEISQCPELKREILCVPGSDYDISNNYDKSYCRQQWQKIIKEKAKAILIKIRVPIRLQRKVISIAYQIGMRMLNWAFYHEGFLGFSREVSFKVLNSSFFTSRGIMDNKKAAEKMIMEEGLNNKQKYELACLYCLKAHIFDFSKTNASEEKVNFYSTPRLIREPSIVMLWNNHLRDGVDKLSGVGNLGAYWLQTAAECGCKTAFEFFFDNSNIDENDRIDAALKAFEKCETMEMNGVWNMRMTKNNDIDWTPSNFYLDILYFFLSDREEKTCIEFLENEFRGLFDCNVLFRVLEYFLDWPYQDYFLKTVGLVWNTLIWDPFSERNYGYLLLKICHKIYPSVRQFQSSYFMEHKLQRLRRYIYSDDSEGETYDYRGLLEEFWTESPDILKRGVFRTMKERGGYGYKFNVGAELLLYFITLDHCTNNDKRLIRLILGDATEEEKRKVFKVASFELIARGEWKVLNSFLQNWISTDLRDTFKRELSVSERAKNTFIYFTRNEKWDKADYFMKWSSLNEEEIAKWKKRIIYSDHGKIITYGILKDEYSSPKKMEFAVRFLRWYLPSEEEVNAFKCDLISEGFF